MSRALELPPEVVLDLPRLLWLGGEELTVENHRGLLEFSPETVRIRIRSGEILVEGERLELERMTGTEIVVRGDLRSVQMIR